jgi:hypothetical protein
MPLDDLLGAARALRQRTAIEAIMVSAAVWGDKSVFRMASWSAPKSQLEMLTPEQRAEIKQAHAFAQKQIERWRVNRAAREADG